MSNTNANAKVRIENTLGFLDFPKHVTGATRESAYSAYNELSRAGVQTLALNFSITDYIDSTGMGALIGLAESARQAGYKVLAYGLSSHYQKLFAMVGLSEWIALYDDEHELSLHSDAAAN